MTDTQPTLLLNVRVGDCAGHDHSLLMVFHGQFPIGRVL